MFCYVSIKVCWVSSCNAVKCTLGLPANFRHCLCLAIFFLCLKSCLIQPVQCWGDKKGSANTLVLSHGSGVISEACVILCA